MDISELGARFKKNGAEIILLEEKRVEVGHFMDAFYAFCVVQGDLYSMNCRYPVLPYYNIGTPKFHDERLFLNRYEQRGQTFEIVERIDLGRGGDPRVVSNGTKAYAVVIHVDIENPASRPIIGALLFDLGSSGG